MFLGLERDYGRRTAWDWIESFWNAHTQWMTFRFRYMTSSIRRPVPQMRSARGIMISARSAPRSSTTHGEGEPITRYPGRPPAPVHGIQQFRSHCKRLQSTAFPFLFPRHLTASRRSCTRQLVESCGERCICMADGITYFTPKRFNALAYSVQVQQLVESVP